MDRAASAWRAPGPRTQQPFSARLTGSRETMRRPSGDVVALSKMNGLRAFGDERPRARQWQGGALKAGVVGGSDYEDYDAVPTSK